MMLLAYPNRDSDCTLAGGAWSVTLPLNNLKTRTFTEFARTTDAAAASTKFTFVFSRVRKIQAQALANHNFSVQAQYRISWFRDVAMTDLAYQSAITDVFPMIYTEETADWDEGNFWDLRITEEDRAAFRQTMIHVAPRRYAGIRAGLVEIFDTANADGYLQAGRLFIADGWTPVFGMGLGAGIQYESRDENAQAYSGARYFRSKPGPRVARFNMPSLTISEGMVNALDFQRQLGTSGECLFMYEQKDTIYKQRRSFIGVPRALSPIEQPYKLEMSNAFEIEESL